MGQQCRPNIRTRAFSAGSDGQWVSGPGSANFRSPQINGLEIKDRESKRLSGRPTSRLAALHSDYLQAGKPLASSFQLFLDSDRNHVVICSLTLSHQPGHPPLPPRYFAARAFSFTSFTSFASLTSSKSFTIRTSMTPLPQVLYNPHLQAPLGSAGNKGLITPLESALTKNSPVTPVESALTKTGGWGHLPNLWHSHSWLCSSTGHRTRNTGTRHIMCPQLQESTSCTIAALAAPDGTSAKLATACGAWAAGAVPTTPNPSIRSSAPWILAAISLTPRGPTAKATASSCSEKSCAPTKTTPSSAGRTRNFTSPQRFRPRTAAGPPAPNTLSTTPILPATSSSTSTRASKTLAWTRSTSFSFTPGKTRGSKTKDSFAPSKNLKPPAKSAPSASASIAGNPPPASAPCAPDSLTPFRSSTTFSIRIPRTNFFLRAAKKMLPSSPASPLTKALLPARSLSTASGPKTTGAAVISFPKISKPASPAPTPSNLCCATA